jgi:hypothetical protein
MIDPEMVGEAGIEPTTPGLEGRCSIRLSYSPAFYRCNFIVTLNDLAGKCGLPARRLTSFRRRQNCGYKRRETHAEPGLRIGHGRSAGGEIYGDRKNRLACRMVRATDHQVDTAAAEENRTHTAARHLAELFDDDWRTPVLSVLPVQVNVASDSACCFFGRGIEFVAVNSFRDEDIDFRGPHRGIRPIQPHERLGQGRQLTDFKQFSDPAWIGAQIYETGPARLDHGCAASNFELPVSFHWRQLLYVLPGRTASHIG